MMQELGDESDNWDVKMNKLKIRVVLEGALMIYVKTSQI